MVYDPAWDMPRVNWQQQGSFENGVIPPSTDPDADTLVCLPPINQDWLPYVLGCLDQLRNPSTWLVPDDDTMYATLERVSRLRQMFGVRAECSMYELRFTAGCVLQSSVDGGTTWVDVPGWDTNYPICNPPQPETRLTADGVLQTSVDGGLTWTDITGWTANSCVIVDNCPVLIGPPPNPGDQSPDQLACSIAAYLSEQVIVTAMGKAVTAISTDLTLLQFGLDVLNVIPEFIIVGLAADAFSAIYVAVQEGTLSDFESALTDATLLAAMRCAIYDCIVTDGYVKPDNFACVLANVGSITYAHADVISAIVSYLTALGATGLAQLSQIAGLEVGADCSACAGAGWCYVWDPATDGNTPPWVPEVYAGSDEMVYQAGVGWGPNFAFTPSGNVVGMSITFASTLIDHIIVERTSTGPTGGGANWIGTSDGHSVDMAWGGGDATTDGNFGVTVTGITIDLGSNPAYSMLIKKVTVTGSGTCPFGTPNC